MNHFTLTDWKSIVPNGVSLTLATLFDHANGVEDVHSGMLGGFCTSNFSVSWYSLLASEVLVAAAG